MRHHIKLALAVVTLFAASSFVGCGDSQQPTDQQTDTQSNDSGHHDEKGPHGGHLIDLGREHAFHAELVEDHAAETISIYILDKNLKEYPIAEPKITLVLDIHGGSETFELTAAQPVDGKSTRFDASDSKLHEELEAHHDASGKLRVTIDGTPYTGTLKHESHDQESHKDHQH